MLCSAQQMGKMAVDGRLYGKHSAVTAPEETRAILPLGATLRVCDCLLNSLLPPIIDIMFPRPNPAVFAGARKFTQPLDISHAAHLTIEKGLDRHSNACVAQADILKFYDQVRLTIRCTYLAGKMVHGCLLGGLLRLHLCTKIMLNISDFNFQACQRTCGISTGSRTAVALRRIPLEDILSRRAYLWSKLGFRLANSHITIATWVDNIFAFAASPAGAIHMLKDIEQKLNQTWKLSYGASSLKYLTCKGHPDPSTPDE